MVGADYGARPRPSPPGAGPDTAYELDEATDELVRGYGSRGRLFLKPAFGRRVARVKWQVSGIVRCFAHASRLR